MEINSDIEEIILIMRDIDKKTLERFLKILNSPMHGNHNTLSAWYEFNDEMINQIEIDFKWILDAVTKAKMLPMDEKSSRRPATVYSKGTLRVRDCND